MYHQLDHYRNDFFIYMFSTFGQISMRNLYYSNCHFGSHGLLNQFSPCMSIMIIKHQNFHFCSKNLDLF